MIFVSLFLDKTLMRHNVLHKNINKKKVKPTIK